MGPESSSVRGNFGEKNTTNPKISNFYYWIIFYWRAMYSIFMRIFIHYKGSINIKNTQKKKTVKKMLTRT